MRKKETRYRGLKHEIHYLGYIYSKFVRKKETRYRGLKHKFIISGYGFMNSVRKKETRYRGLKQYKLSFSFTIFIIQ